MNIAQTGTAPATAVIADLVREYAEDTPEAAWREGAAQYEARLQFARFILRARELQGQVWDAYTVVSDKVALLESLLDEPAFEARTEARAAVMRRFLDLLTEQKRRFEVWQALQALAFVRDEAQLSPEKARAGFAAVQWIEEQKADELLQTQAARAAYSARTQTQHAQAEAEQAQAEQAQAHQAPPTEATMGAEWNSPDAFEAAPDDLPEPPTEDLDEGETEGDEDADPFAGE